MDKNTFTGLLLMGAIILGFMWLQQPSEEERQRQREQAERLAAQEQQQAPQPVLTLDSVTPAEVDAIRSTVASLGNADSLGNRTLTLGGVHLNVAADGTLSGTVDVPDAGVYPVADIVANRWGNTPTYVAADAVAELRAALTRAARYRGFARYTAGDSVTITLENDLLRLDLSNHGGMIAAATLKEYQAFDSTLVQVISPETDDMSFTLTSATQRFDTSEFFFDARQESDTTAVMEILPGDGARFAIRYTLLPGTYLVKMELEQQGMENVIPRTVAHMDFTWRQRMRRNEAGRMFEERNSAIYYMFPGGEVDNLSETSSESEELNERLKWIGFKNQFFSAVMMARTNFAAATLRSTVLEADRSPLYLKDLEAQTTLEYSSTAASPAAFTFYLGPNSYPLLSDISETVYPDEDMHLTRLIPLGWSLFRWINTLIVIPVFDLLGSHIASYGLIILLLTLFIKLILFPFTYKSYMSQARMRVLAPEVKAINDKWPGNDNAMKRQQETMALYSRAGASPFSGCLPMLLQMPILIAMFSFFPSAIELRGKSFLWAHDLSAPDAIISWTTNIPFISSTFGNHISLFCLLMTAVNIIYTKISMQSQPSSSAMPGMKWMMYLMPVMFLVFFNNYASGLSYYYFLSLLITIVQTWIFRRVVNEDKVRAQMAASAKKPRKKSGFMARLEEAQRRQQAMLREQQKQQQRRR